VESEEARDATRDEQEHAEVGDGPVLDGDLGEAHAPISFRL
jgi:hypothetical protein